MFEVNKAQFDWLTVTSFDDKCGGAMYTWHMGVSANQKDSKRLQYQGTTAADRYGSSFFGEGHQRGRRHYMMQVSGSLAESAWTAVQAFTLGGMARVTRLDLQITVEYDRQDHSQEQLAADLRHESPNRSVSYIESRSGPQGTKLATVYYGSRTSERYCRIYEKLGMGDEVLLRFEMEFKGKVAKAVRNALLQGTSPKAVLFGEYDRMPQVYGLARTFGKVLQTKPYYTRVVREPGGTEVWLKGKVATSLDRYLNSHEEDSQAMAEHFLKVIEQHL